MNAERWLCLDCLLWSPLSEHLRCPSCQSDAVVSEHAPTVYPASFDLEELMRDVQQQARR